MAQTKVGSGFVATGAVGPTSLSTGAPYWDSSGNVGIGTSSPAYKLHVADTSTAAIGAFRDLDVTVVGAASTTISIGARDGSTFTAGAQITGVLGNPATTGYLTFSTRSSGANSERMRIDSSGNVGIGTASPSTILHLYAATPTLSITSTTTTGTTIGNKGNRLLLISNSVTAGNGGEVVFAGADTNVGRAGAISFYYTNGDLTSYAGAITFATKLQADTALTERMRIDSSGNVGIGTTSPSYRLDVSGSGRVTGDFYVGPSTNIIYESGSNLNVRAANALLFLTSGANERARIDSSGNLLVGTTTSTSRLTVFDSRYNTANAGTAIVSFSDSNGRYSNFYAGADGTTFNAANTILGVRNATGTGRSINASGTINASGADYAEYMTKAGDFIITKGDIVGINAEGKLTNVFSDAVSFAVKSTNPSYVGGDTWGNEEAVGERPSPDATQEEQDAFNKTLEAARQKVDRIAFAGQVPVNVFGAISGQYIIPTNDNGAIKGEAVSSPTFEQYQIAVGKVIAIESDGRAKIIVKVA